MHDIDNDNRMPYQYIKVFQFGIGGTGSYLTPPLMKYLNSLVNAKEIQYMLIDNDIVELKNVYRQNFRFEDIDKKKCDVFWSHHKNYPNIHLRKADIRFNENNFDVLSQEMFDTNNTLNLVIGCVDNIETRFNIAQYLEYYIKSYKPINQSIYYIDSGNLINTGQVYVFDYKNNTAEDITKTIDNIFNDPSVIDIDKQPSCSDNGDQSIMANLQAASILFNIISEIITIGSTTLKHLKFMRYYRTIDYDGPTQLKNGMY